MSDSNDTQQYIDMALQEAVMISFAVPGAGPAIAALMSGIQAIYDMATTRPTQISNYSVEVAFADLEKHLDQKLDKDDLKKQMAVISACHQAGDTDESTFQRAQKDSHYWDDEKALSNLENEVSMLHVDISNAKSPIIPVLNWLEGRTGEAMVASLDTYLIARHNFQRMCIKKLNLQALVLQRQALNRGRKIEAPAYYDTHNPLIDDLNASLTQAINYAGPKVKHLQDTFSNRVADAKRKSVELVSKPGLARQQAFIKALQQINEDAHVLGVDNSEVITEQTVAKLAKMLDAFRITQAGLEHKPSSDTTAKGKGSDSGSTYAPLQQTGDTGGQENTDNNPSQPAGQTVITAPATRLKAGKVSFLFESSPTGGYVGALQDSPVCDGYVATQNAGSTNSGMYYMVDGGFLNGYFKAALLQSTQLNAVNSALQAAYDNHFGKGEYARDEKSGRQDRLTSFIVPIRNNVPNCVGKNVIAMIYSVGPKLGSAGITDEVTYQQIYTDALDAVAQWNITYPKAQIKGVRLTMLSTGAYSGSSDAAALVRRSADLILSGIVAAVNIHPTLAKVMMIINCNDSSGSGKERTAFTAAAKQRNANLGKDGFVLAE